MKGNRGKRSGDDRLFGGTCPRLLSMALDDAVYLLSRGYGERSVIQMVGNRYKLSQRQRLALQGAMASRDQVERRKMKECRESDLAGQPVAIDGFNLIILLESALSGAFVFQGRDGCCRDLSGVHGSYRQVRKTAEAIEMTGHVLNRLNVRGTSWLLDRPVSNSGRLKSDLQTVSERFSFSWEVELAYNPDKILAERDAVIVTSDSWVLDRAARWFNLGRYLIENHIREANRVKL